MLQIFQNKYFRYLSLGVIGFIGLGVALMVFWFITNLLAGSISGGLSSMKMRSDSTSVPNLPISFEDKSSIDFPQYERISMDENATYPSPDPDYQGYTTGLETYETTTYTSNSSIKNFDSLCATLADFKIKITHTSTSKISTLRSIIVT